MHRPDSLFPAGSRCAAAGVIVEAMGSVHCRRDICHLPDVFRL